MNDPWAVGNQKGGGRNFLNGFDNNQNLIIHYNQQKQNLIIHYTQQKQTHCINGQTKQIACVTVVHKVTKLIAYVVNNMLNGNTREKREKKTHYSSLKTKHILPLQSLMSVISVESELSTKGRISQTE